MVRRLAMPVLTAGALWATAQMLVSATAALLGTVEDGTAELNELLGLAAALGAWVVLAWVAVVLLSTAIATLPGILGRAGARAARRLTPAAARNAARFALGLAVTAGPVVAGPAAVGLPAGTDGGGYVEEIDISGLPGVGRPGEPVPPGNAREPGSPTAVSPKPTADSSFEPDPAGPPAAGAGPAADAGLTPEPVREADPGDQVVVQRGDTLWAIAERHLGPGATAGEIAAEWPRWYAANRSVIGDDPDLILPGTILRQPHDR